MSKRNDKARQLMIAYQKAGRPYAKRRGRRKSIPDATGEAPAVLRAIFARGRGGGSVAGEPPVGVNRTENRDG